MQIVRRWHDSSYCSLVLRSGSHRHVRLFGTSTGRSVPSLRDQGIVSAYLGLGWRVGAGRATTATRRSAGRRRATVVSLCLRGRAIISQMRIIRVAPSCRHPCSPGSCFRGLSTACKGCPSNRRRSAVCEAKCLTVQWERKDLSRKRSSHAWLCKDDTQRWTGAGPARM